MKKFFKAALLTVLFTACIGLTALADNEAATAAASGGDSGTTQTPGGSVSDNDPGTTPKPDDSDNKGETPTKPTTSGNSGTTSGNSGSKPTQATEDMQKATTVEVKAADGTTVEVEVKAVSADVQKEAVREAGYVVSDNGVLYGKDAYAPVVTVDVVVKGDKKPDGSVTVTLKHASIEAGATYVVNHKKSDGKWEQRVVKAGEAGKFDVDLTSLSPVSFYKVVVLPPASHPTANPGGCNGGLEAMIGGTAEGGVIKLTKNDGVTSLTMDMVKKIVDRNLTLVMEYTYNGADYRIVIPGKKAVIDESVPIYGPLYLAAHYSSNAAVGGSSNGVTYTIAKGDTLSRIAAVNGTTVAALAALNPQIKDVNVIYTGQSINLK